MDTITDLGDELPAAGEPLKPKTHPANAEALKAELDERIARLSGKMSRKLHKRTQAEFHKLWAKLYKSRYARLVTQRDQLHKEYLELAESFKKANEKRRKTIAEKARQIAKQGRALNQKIQQLQPMYMRWLELKNLLDEHDRAIAYEREEKENERAFYKEARTWEEQMKGTMRRLPELRQTGVTKAGKPYTKIPEFEGIDFRVDSVYYKIKTSYQTWWSRFRRNKWYDALPDGVSVPDLTSERTLKNLEASTNRVVRAATSEIGRGIYWIIDRPDSPEGIPKHVYYSNLIQYYPRDLHTKTPFMAGITTNRKLLYYTLEENPHLLIAGTTNSGKSTFVNSMIATCISMNKPDELRLVLIDLKGGIELQHFEAAKHNLMPLVREREDVLNALVAVRKLMQRRLKALSKANVKKASIFNLNVKEESRMARILLLIDEMALLAGMGDTTRQIQDELRIISSQGRAANVHLVLCTQNTNVAIIEGPTKTNMVMRISGKMPDLGSSMSILGSAAATKLPDGIPGRFVFSRGLTEAIAQTPDITDEEIAKAVLVANKYPDPVNVEEFQDLHVISIDDKELANDVDKNESVPTPISLFGRDEFLEIAISKFDGKLSPKRIHPALGNEIITRRKLEELCKSIISEGSPILHKGSSYELKKVGQGYVVYPSPQKNEVSPHDLTIVETPVESVERGNVEVDTEEAA